MGGKCSRSCTQLDCVSDYLWKVSLTLLQNVLVWDVCATGQRFRYYVVLIVISLGMS